MRSVEYKHLLWFNCFLVFLNCSVIKNTWNAPLPHRKCVLCIWLLNDQQWCELSTVSLKISFNSFLPFHTIHSSNIFRYLLISVVFLLLHSLFFWLFASITANYFSLIWSPTDVFRFQGFFWRQSKSFSAPSKTSTYIHQRCCYIVYFNFLPFK